MTGDNHERQGKRVLLFGASGTIGRATAQALVQRGHDVRCLLRSVGNSGLEDLPGIELREGDVCNPQTLRDIAFEGEGVDAVMSCLASRNGAPQDAWAVDYRAHVEILNCARQMGVSRFVMLSAICVQKPLLAFQHAKLAFEAQLQESGLRWSIVRPTAFFKSLSGQARRLRAGKPFLVFGDGQLTACKPISDRDTANYLADCLEDEALQDAILPIGGPGDAITPLEQGEMMFAAFGLKPRFRHVPVGMLDAIIGGLSLAGRVSSGAAAKAELARIGRYYATESMLVLEPATGRYDAAATPSYGKDNLGDHYARLASGDVGADLRDHSVF
ncbi:MAG: NAD(P)H-binding protein [Nitratireductor sp.]